MTVLICGGGNAKRNKSTHDVCDSKLNGECLNTEGILTFSNFCTIMKVKGKRRQNKSENDGRGGERESERDVYKRQVFF